MSHAWSEHTSDEIREKVGKGWTTAILPVGAIEQHGPHLSVCYDSAIANTISIEIAKSLEKAWVLPSLHYGASSHHLGFCGTLSLSDETVISLLTDVARSLKLSGINRMIIINGHGGNYSVISKFANTLSLDQFRLIHDGDEKFIFSTIRTFSDEFGAAALGLHAGLFETALALYTHPNLLRVDRASKGLMPLCGDHWSQAEIQKLMQDGLVGVTENGIIGDPFGATPEIGKRFYHELIRRYLTLCLND